MSLDIIHALFKGNMLVVCVMDQASTAIHQALSVLAVIDELKHT